MAEKPVVYILHGDDEYALAQFIANMEKKLGDPVSAEMNITRLDGRIFSPQAMISATHTMPFLTERRLVVLTDPLGGMKSQPIRKKFRSILEQIPATTALALVIHRPLVNARDKKQGTQHWLQKWAAKQGGRVYMREFLLPQGPQMARWIQGQAKDMGGEFSFEAAGLLANFVSNDPRWAAQEVEKLLAYANYSRPVEPDDVENLTTYAGEGDVFAMVDALGNRDGQQALRMLHRLLDNDEPLRLYGMIVRQFRLLLLTRELLDSGFREAEIARKLKTYPFVARKLIGQTRNFSIEALEDIYHKLLDLDEAMKTGQIEGETALDTLMAALTT
ncbi:MAG: DNA polymerase III subunit delta [Chloroflexi bacterium]|nr:DNA polymerase III subunit delta [Chloroflexota bacterium]